MLGEDLATSHGVSIHAPVKGRHQFFVFFFPFFCFNPRPREGATGDKTYHH